MFQSVGKQNESHLYSDEDSENNETEAVISTTQIKCKGFKSLNNEEKQHRVFTFTFAYMLR